MSVIAQNGLSNGMDCNGQKKKYLKSKVPAEEHEEHQYLSLIRHILDKGAVKEDRTGVGTHSVFGTQMRFSLRNGKSVKVSRYNKLKAKGSCNHCYDFQHYFAREEIIICIISCKLSIATFFFFFQIICTFYKINYATH